MNEKTEKLLRDLADKLGVSVEYLWHVMVRGNKTEGYILLGFVILGLLVACGGGYLLRLAWKDTNDNEDFYIPFGLGGIAVGLILSGLCTYWCVMDLVQPEYGALMEIMAHLGK
jgi:hypothetical protein